MDYSSSIFSVMIHCRFQCPLSIPTSLITPFLRQSSTSRLCQDFCILTTSPTEVGTLRMPSIEITIHRHQFVLGSFSVVVTIDPMDVSTLVVASVYREVQHAIALCLLYKSNALCPIPTSSCVLASIANNKGTLNPPASTVCFLQDLSLALSLVLSLLCLRSLVLA
jgi:hypothetical protein